jgi:hypothetical protein
MDNLVYRLVFYLRPLLDVYRGILCLAFVTPQPDFVRRHTYVFFVFLVYLPLSLVYALRSRWGLYVYDPFTLLWQ